MVVWGVENVVDFFELIEFGVVIGKYGIVGKDFDYNVSSVLDVDCSCIFCFV